MVPVNEGAGTSGAESAAPAPAIDGRPPRRAVVVTRHGGPEVLEIREVERTVPRAGEVEVRVSHVALNHLDVWVRRGVPGHDFHLPHIPGSDVAGTVDGRAVALFPSWGCGTCPACLSGWQNRCRNFRIRGENVDGGCVTHLVVPAWQVLPVPPGLSLVEAAALPLTLLTAWHMLVVRARLGRGERVLVQAGGSGVGVVAIQIARLFGCEVHATASTAERRDRLEALGARAWPYEAVGARGSGLPPFDVVVETVGEPTRERSIRALAWGGRLVCCGATAGADVDLNLRVLFFKQIELVGSTMGNPADLQAAWREVAAGRIRPIVDRVLPMTRIAEGHALLEERGAFGKVVLEQDLG
jgi:NADPH:quinone reductase-like Zn-dependent oxidoreductase